MRKTKTLNRFLQNQPKCLNIQLGLGLFLFLFSHISFSQNYPQTIINLGIEDGLSQATVNCIVQDKKGFIWIGTQDGLNRYDGYRVVSFIHKPDDMTSLSNNYVNQVIIDHQDDLWILTPSGLDKFDYQTEKFIHYPMPTNTQSKTLYYWSMQSGNNDNIWITTSDGLIEFNQKTEKFHYFSSGQEYGLSTNNTYHTVTVSKENILVTTDNGLYNFDHNNNKYHPVPLPQTIDSKQNARINCISNIVNDLYFLCSENGIYVFYQNQYYFISNQNLGIRARTSKILIGEKNELWIATLDGLYLKQIDRENLFSSLSETINLLLKEQNITELYQDKNKVLWIGTNINGAFKLLPLAHSFLHFSSQSNANTKLASNVVISISQSPLGDVWVGDTQGGITIVSNNTSQKTFNLKNNRGENFHHNILDIEFDGDSIWIANAQGITRANTTFEAQETFNLYDQSGQHKTYATQVFKTPDGKLWLTGLKSGLNLYNRKNKKFEPIVPQNWTHQFPFAEYTYIAIVKGNYIWMAGYKGTLYQYDFRNNIGKTYPTHEIQNPRQSVSQVYGLTFDKLDHLWVTGVGGIGRFFPEEEKFEYFSKLSSITSQSFYSIVSDDSGYLWTTPSDKLIRIDPKDFSILSFDKTMGMPIVEFSPALLKQNNGKIWAGGLNGLIQFQPKNIMQPANDVIPQLTGIELMHSSPETNQQTIWKRYPVTQEKANPVPAQSPHLSFPPETSIKFNFSILDYSRSASIRYRYKLQGFEQRWQLIQESLPQAIYTKLPHGKYQFEVSTSVDGDNWSQPHLLAKLEIQPYFWQTTLFNLSLLILVLTLIKIVFSWKAHRLKIYTKTLEKEVNRQTTEIQNLLEQRTRFFSFISHELKTPLSLVQDPLNRLQQKDKSNPLLKLALNNASKLTSLVNKLLKTSTIEQNEITHPIPVDLKIREAYSQLAELAQQKSIELHLRKLDTCQIIARESDIEAILYNLISNAIKHNSPNGQVFTSCIRTKSNIMLNVIDRGPGIDLADNKDHKITEQLLTENSKHHGLHIVQQAVEQLNGKIKIRSRINHGTLFSILLPVPVIPNLIWENKKNNKLKISEEKPDNKVIANAKKSLPLLFIVEDNDELRNYIHELFIDNYNCEVFSSAEPAFEKACEMIPDIIISDVMLPGMSGVNLCQKLNKEQTTCHIPILLLSAKSDQASVIDGLTKHATDYMSKPFNSQELQLKIANLVALTQHNYASNHQVSLNHLYTSEENSPSGLGEADRAFMRRFVECLDKHYCNNEITLDLIASALFISKKQLTRKLQAICDKSPMEYLKEYRLEKSTQFLLKGYPISQVSADCGFSSQSYFSTCFKQYFSETPKNFQLNMIKQKRKSSKNNQ